jgi:hypothetical protein
MSRTSLTEQAQRQLPSREFGIVVGVDSHRMNEAAGLYEFCVRFYSGYRAWQLYPYVQKLDAVKQYVAPHRLDTPSRKRTSVQQHFGSQDAGPLAHRVRRRTASQPHQHHFRLPLCPHQCQRVCTLAPRRHR